MAGSSAVQLRSRLSWNVLILALILEAFLLIWVVYVTVLGALAEAEAFAQNLSLVAMAVVSLVWVLVTLAGAVRTKASWVRGSATTIHVLLFAAGTGLLQIQIGPWWLGFGLIALALIGFFASILARPTSVPTTDDSDSSQPS